MRPENIQVIAFESSTKIGHMTLIENVRLTMHVGGKKVYGVADKIMYEQNPYTSGEVPCGKPSKRSKSTTGVKGK